MYLIYRLTHVSGKFYVGCTKQGLQKRWQDHWTDAQTKYLKGKFQQFLLTTTRDEWKKEVLEVVENKDKEFEWIQNLYNENCLNLMKEKNKFENRPVPIRTDEWKRNAMLGQPTRKEVICVETNQVFKSVSEFCRQTGYKASRSCLSEKLVTGFRYKGLTYKSK